MLTFSFDLQDENKTLIFAFNLNLTCLSATAVLLESNESTSDDREAVRCRCTQ